MNRQPHKQFPRPTQLDLHAERCCSNETMQGSSSVREPLINQKQNCPKSAIRHALSYPRVHPCIRFAGTTMGAESANPLKPATVSPPSRGRGLDVGRPSSGGGAPVPTALITGGPGARPVVGSPCVQEVGALSGRKKIPAVGV